jgi:dihydroxy-acid dehydratase
MMAGHVSPEAERGGPIALVRDGDVVTIDLVSRRLDLDADLAARAASSPAPRRAGGTRPASGVLAKYAALVSSASEGAVTRSPEGPSSGGDRHG